MNDNTEIRPIVLDIISLRKNRQKINNEQVFNSLLDNKVHEDVNLLEFNRVLSELNMTKDELLNYCSVNTIGAKILAGRIAKNASRQGSKDENTQFQVCIDTASKCGIYIKN